MNAADDLFAAVANTPAAKSLVRRLEDGGALSCTGISPAAQPFLAVLLHRIFPGRPLVVVTEGLKTQESFQQDIETWLGKASEFKVQSSKFKVQGGGGSKVQGPKSKVQTQDTTTEVVPAFSKPLFYPAWEILPHEAKLPHADVISERLETLVAVSGAAAAGDRAAPMVVTNVVALLERTFSAEALKAGTRKLNRGDRIEPLDLVEWLEAQGYEPEAQVTQKGEMSLRGGILDVYPMTSPWPVRLEFFGDELESLRWFDPLTQVSREETASITMPPAGELGVLKRGLATAAESGKPESIKLATLLDYLPCEAIVLVCEPQRVAEQADAYAEQVPENDPFFISWEDFHTELGSRGMTAVDVFETNETPGEVPGSQGAQEESLELTSLDAFRPLGERAPEPQIAEAQRREFFAQMHRWLRQEHEVHVFCNNDGERQRFEEIWKDYLPGEKVLGDNPASLPAHEPPPPPTLSPPGGEGGRSSASRRGHGLPKRPTRARESVLPELHIGALARGFLCDEAGLVVVTDAEIFGRYKVQRPRRLKSPHAQAARSALDIDFTDFEEGDYVVHLQHGIGRYLGLKVLPTRIGKSQESSTAPAETGEECLVIEYAANDPEQAPPKLYVPVTEAHLVGKYVGAGKARPPLNTLGGTRWAKAKAQAEEAVRDVASELLSIQAARETQAGHAFAVDTPWQREFESAFLYEETPDQARAITEAKTDMERPKPMDRLICGDVGFGKTEVAIRAAFKAVMDGRQVAILVPTTVLAQQHFNTFRERMADYPVRIELLSRFRTAREQKQVVKELQVGAVDIVIGTHRLLQEDIGFKDLGLVVIDEEQRFGVMHKEKFKLLRKLVDVLTLSATPIPRTLYLALTGARDMSTIETPPQDRLPVETIVAQYDERLIRDSIQRELNRGGQVFFLHNRVETIQNMALKLRGLLPQARIVVGHGQMGADDLEEVMTAFVNGEADVLLSTTIIESGLDIPNANTIIIDRADRFGLSDLYQLRGRVGRYKHQAYAYLLLPRHAGLLGDARKRITALRQYSTLGSGFKIAMRDLEIRGAGNMLGPEQSGQITAVGFELYCQLLKQSVAAQKGEKVKPRVEVIVRLDFVALTPGEETDEVQSPKSKVQSRLPKVEINIPREVASYVVLSEAEDQSQSENPKSKIERVSAFIPLAYVGEARQRIDVYRKLAQATDKAALERLRVELRDRFGPLPAAMERLLLIGELKILASEKGIAVLEVKDDKLMMTRNEDFIMLGGKFPRLAKTEAEARLKEIKKLLLAL